MLEKAEHLSSAHVCAPSRNLEGPSYYSILTIVLDQTGTNIGGMIPSLYVTVCGPLAKNHNEGELWVGSRLAALQKRAHSICRGNQNPVGILHLRRDRGFCCANGTSSCASGTSLSMSGYKLWCYFDLPTVDIFLNLIF